MRSILIFTILLTLAGCGISESRFNPLNWFGNDKSEAPVSLPAETGDPALLDPRPLIGQITELAIERAAGGAIVRATGIAPTSGYHSAELVPLANETPVNGSLVYFFRVEAPLNAAGAGSLNSRTITVARFVPDSVLFQARNILVRADTNQRRASR